MEREETERGEEYARAPNVRQMKRGKDKRMARTQRGRNGTK